MAHITPNPRRFFTHTGGAMNVHDVSDTLHTTMVNRWFGYHTGVVGNPTVAITAGDTSISVDAAIADGVSSGDDIVIIEDSKQEKFHFNVTAVASPVFTLDRPIDLTYTTSAVIEKIIHDASNVVTSGATVNSAYSFRVAPLSGETFVITRVNVIIHSDSAPTDVKFGNLDPLPNGLIFRQVSPGSSESVTRWNTNGDIALDAGVDMEYHTAAGPSNDGVRTRWTFERAGVKFTVNGSLGEYLEWRVQDPLDDLVLVEMKAQGYLSE